MQPKPGPAAPVAPATGNPGLAAAAKAEVREAISIMEKALPSLETGSEEYKSVLDSLSKLTKHFPAASAMPGVQKTALAGLAQRASQDGMMRQAMAARAAQGGGGPGAGPGPQPQPQPGPMVGM